VPRVSAARPSRYARPKLGQHFLVDDAAAIRIVDALGDISQTTVLEIGPGRGAITERLTNLNSQTPIQVQPAFLPTRSEKPESTETGIEDVIKDLTEAKQHDFSSPDSAMKRRRRKKRRGRSL